MANQNANEISEQLFQAIDAIVAERIRVLNFDRTVIATIIDNSEALYGRYKVTTDTNITFIAYCDITNYPLYERVYVRIPENDYTKQKTITGRYVQENRTAIITDIKTSTIIDLQKKITQCQADIALLTQQLQQNKEIVEEKE